MKFQFSLCQRCLGRGGKISRASKTLGNRWEEDGWTLVTSPGSLCSGILRLIEKPPPCSLAHFHLELLTKPLVCGSLVV